MTDEEKILKEIEDQIVAGEEKALKFQGSLPCPSPGPLSY